jgi:tetratricopeptide (TPR) repeat protein
MPLDLRKPLNQDARRLQRQASLLENRGDYEKALELYLHLYGNYSDYTPFYEGVIRGFIASQKYTEGLAWTDSLKRNIQEQNRYADLTTAQREQLAYLIVDGGRFCGHLSRRDEALLRWEELYSLPLVSQNPFIRLFSAMLDIRYPDGLEEMARRARTVTGIPSLLSSSLANYWANRGQLDRALDEWLWLMEVQPRQERNIKRQILNLTEDETTRGQIEAALREALSRSSIRLQVTELLGEFYFRNRDWEAAYESVRNADQLGDGQGNSLLAFVENLITETEFDLARKILSDMAESHPDLMESPRGWLALARVIEGQEAFAEADSVYSRLTATAHLKSVQGQEAIILQADLRLNRLRQPAAARSLLEESLLRMPHIRSRTEAALLIADTYLAEEDLVIARRTYLETANGHHGKNVDIQSKALVNAARVDFYLGAVDSAMTRLQLAARRNPAGTLTNDALDMMEMLRDGAVDSVGLVLMAEADFAERLAHTSEAESLYVMTADRTQSSNLAERALRRIANIRRDQNRSEEAIEALETALNRFPNSLGAPEILLEIGDIVENDLGDPKQAVEFYERILLEYPESLQGEEARERIRDLESLET